MKLSITKKAEKELDKLPDQVARNIVRKVLLLADGPYPVNSKKLKGDDNYRLRVGSFRVIYTVDTKGKEVTVLRVADRKRVYR
jgi:mRNA interferase RelE/StbE